MVGSRRWPVAEITIQKAKPTMRNQKGEIVRAHTAPFMPKTFKDAYHPGGNSLCYMIQTAHLMGCAPIYCLGFTLSNGSGYFFGLENPVKRRRSFYSDPSRAMDWLSWYNSKHPGRAKLWPGWSGPIYDGVLEVVDEQESRRLCGRLPLSGTDESVSTGEGHAAGE